MKEDITQEIDAIVFGNDAFAKERLIERGDIKLEKRHVDQLLHDSSSRVRMLLAKRRDVEFTQEQIRKGLDDEIPGVRQAFYKRPELSMTFEVFLDLYIDEHPDIAVSYLYRDDVVFTDDMINEIMEHGDSIMKHALINRAGDRLTDEQISRLLDDMDLALPIIENPEIKLTNEHASKILYGGMVCDVIDLGNREDFKPTFDQIMRYMQHDDPRVRAVLAARDDLRIPKDVIEMGVRDPETEVRYAWNERMARMALQGDKHSKSDGPGRTRRHKQRTM